MAVCFQYHGCDCQLRQRGQELVFKGKTLLERRHETEEKIAVFKAAFPDLEVKIQWECSYNNERKHNSRLNKWLASKPALHPGYRLRARDAVRGGFTEIYRTNWTNNDDEIFCCDDLNSIYAHICTYLPNAVGKYVVLLANGIAEAVEITDTDILVSRTSFLGVALVTVVS